MATVDSIKNQLKANDGQPPRALSKGVKGLMESSTVQEKFRTILKDKAQGFMASVLTLVSNDSYLAQAEPMSVLTGAMTAATLDLPLDKNLGYAYLVPFRDKGIQKAQFILGYKGYIQMALRTAQYRALNVIEVYEGELKSWNRLEEEIDFDFEGHKSDKVIGYCAYFELLNGFRKVVYWTKADVEAHRKKYVKAGYTWKDNYDAMAMKTVLKHMLKKWGILSIEMQRAFSSDDSVQEMDLDTREIKVAYPVEDSEPEAIAPQPAEAEPEIGQGELFSTPKK